jgi:hypothetical protein
MVGLLMGGVLPKVASGGSDLLTKQHLIPEMSSYNAVMVLDCQGFSSRASVCGKIAKVSRNSGVALCG